MALLLVSPCLAVHRLSPTFDPRIAAGYWLGVSLITYGLYRRDKQRAIAQGWRTPEATLHLAELMGGWAAAFLAQRMLRHKIAKPRYQFTFWSIIALHEYVALDFLLGWKLLDGAWQLVKT